MRRYLLDDFFATPIYSMMIKICSSFRIGLVLLFSLFLQPAANAAAVTAPATTQTLQLPGGNEVALRVYPAQGNSLLLWLPTESGIVAADHKTAAVLARLGIEVWLPDLHAAYFLPIVPSSLQQIPAADVARVIALAQSRGKAVYLASGGSGAALALQGAALQTKNSNPLRGAILLSPNLFAGTPQPGEDAKYLPIASHTRLPIVILQPDNSPWKWRVEELQSRLQQGGSTVSVKSLPGIRDRFYYREDASPTERGWAARLPELMMNALNALKEKQ